MYMYPLSNTKYDELGIKSAATSTFFACLADVVTPTTAERYGEANAIQSLLPSTKFFNIVTCVS